MQAVATGALAAVAAGSLLAYNYFKDAFRDPPERDVNLVRRLGKFRYVSSACIIFDKRRAR